MGLNGMTRRATLAWLDTVRLPLTAAEQVAKRAGQEHATSAPAAAFGSFEATVKETVGRLTGDDTLQGLARLQRAELEQRGRAAEKQTEAAAVREAALREAEQREAALERQRAETQRRADARERQVEQERLDAERKVANQTANKKAALRESARKVDQALDEKAKRAEAERLRIEAEALRAKEHAVAAQGAVLDLDKAVKTKKAARKSG